MGTLQSVPVPRGQYLATYSQVLSYQTLRCPIAKACRPPSTGCNPWPRIKNCPRLATPWAVLNCQRTTPPLPYSTNEKHTRAKKISPVRKFSLSEKTMQLFYINLDRRADRNAEFLRRNSRAADCQRVRACEGGSLRTDDLR